MKPDLGTHDCPSCGHTHHGPQHKHVIVHGKCDHLLSQCCEKHGGASVHRSLEYCPECTKAMASEWVRVKCRNDWDVLYYTLPWDGIEGGSVSANGKGRLVFKPIIRVRWPDGTESDERLDNPMGYLPRIVLSRNGVTTTMNLDAVEIRRDCLKRAQDIKEEDEDE